MSKCYWITGLSGAGKTTLADKVKAKIGAAVVLDGDVIRELLNTNFGHDRESRLQLAYTYSRFAKYLVESGVNVICSTISMFHEVQEWNRNNIPNYVEIFLDVDMTELERRDSKKIYSRARSGELKDVVGVDIKAEFPKKPDFRIKNNEDTEKFLRSL